MTWVLDPARRWRSLAVAVGGALRLGWALVATTTPTSPFTDAANYLHFANDLADFHTPTFGGIPSALYPSGYPAALVPLVWLSRTGLISLPLAASLLNVVFGTATIAATGLLARRWLGARAATPAAWLVALSPALVYFTSAAVTETLCLFAVTVGLVLLGREVDGERRTARFAVIGAFVGYAVLVRTPGAVLLVAPLLMVRARDERWRGALRPTLAVALGACVLLVPWTIRNGVQVGVWTPGSTNNAVVMCMGHWDGANGVNNESLAQFQHCYPGSPWDNAALPYEPGQVPAGIQLGRPDEGRWYRETSTAAAKWAVTHPSREVRLTFWKTEEVLGSDGDALGISRNFEATDQWPSPFVAQVLALLPNVWLWFVECLAVLGLVTLRSTRRALPVWGPAIPLLVLIWGGVAQAHYKLPMLPLLAALAGATVAALAAGARADDPAEDDAQADDADAGADADEPTRADPDARTVADRDDGPTGRADLVAGAGR